VGGERSETRSRTAERAPAGRAPTPGPSLSGRGTDLAICIALAFPDRIAKRRDGSGENWASVGGRGFRLDPASSLARAEWLAVAETQGMAAGARILSAAEIDYATIEALFGARIETRRSASFDAATGRVEAVRERRLGALRLSSGPDSGPIDTAALLLEAVRAHGLGLLPWSETAQALRLRARFAGIAALEDEALLAALDDWLPALLEGKRRFDAVAPGELTQALHNLLGWEGQKTLDRLAPARLDTPAGSSHAIDYGAEAGPTVEVRVQALFGLAEHPLLGDGTPLVLSLTSPAGRPIQTTRDLPGFWKGSWAAVAKEMRGRYPRHPWPDDPASASATLKTKKADARSAAAR
jgi:ATP-dependent helicase HrpB